ncbi:MAG TPA: ABC transporter ATP-binding protein [bacterium]|nr:ABC transporter ATP-binding protein [bacterium]
MKLRLEHLSRIFFRREQDFFAVHDVNLEVHDREFFVLLGPSGCGKSTLLNLIAGLEKPSKGTIWFDGQRIACVEEKSFRTPRERNVAMVFQSYALYPHLTVFDNIAFPLRMEKMKKDDIRKAVREAAEILRITLLLESKPGQLSGGERQRVAIARAVVRRPSVFLLDEPLSNLDAQLRTSMRQELKDIQARLGITTIYVTHDQVEAMTLGDRIAVLKNGRIEQIGTPDELYRNPQNAFVGTFIGTPAMNLISAHYDKSQDILQFGNETVHRAAERVTALNTRETGPCFLGVRPEHIRLNGAGDVSLSAKIDYAESLGRENLFRISFDGQKLSVLGLNPNLKAGDEVQWSFDYRDLHLFDESRA